MNLDESENLTPNASSENSESIHNENHDTSDPTYNINLENPEDELDDIVENIVDERDKNFFNFLINASNQANLANAHDSSYTQLNALFVLIHPYHMESFNIEGLNLDITMSEDGSVYIKGKKFETIEIQPGIKVFGIVKK